MIGESKISNKILDVIIFHRKKSPVVLHVKLLNKSFEGNANLCSLRQHIY